MVVTKKTKIGTFFLHNRKTKTGGTLFFFSKKKTGALSTMPKGFRIKVAKTGLPLLKKK